VVAASYKGNKKLARMLYGLKYKSHDEELGEKLSTLIWNAMNRVFSEEVLGRVVVIPVPLYAKRLQERGFNQSEVLTQCFRGGISVRTDVLERHEKTKSQVEAGKRKERQENLKGAFRVVVQSFERGQSLDPNAFYLIVDDVCTTGSTLEECCSTLRSAGAKYVWGATVARA
jgi:ComF family protein